MSMCAFRLVFTLLLLSTLSGCIGGSAAGESGSTAGSKDQGETPKEHLLCAVNGPVKGVMLEGACLTPNLQKAEIGIITAKPGTRITIRFTKELAQTLNLNISDYQLHLEARASGRVNPLSHFTNPQILEPTSVVVMQVKAGMSGEFPIYLKTRLHNTKDQFRLNHQYPDYPWLILKVD